MLSIVEGIFDERVLWLMENGWMLLNVVGWLGRNNIKAC